MFSKVTNDGQKRKDVTLAERCIARAGHFSVHEVLPKAGARVWRPGPDWRNDGGKLRWDWGRIEDTFDSSEARLHPLGTVTACDHPAS